MRVPFIYCDQDGPIHYNGMIEKLEGRTAWIHLETDDPLLEWDAQGSLPYGWCNQYEQSTPGKRISAWADFGNWL